MAEVCEVCGHPATVAPVDPATLAARQLSCWEALTWVAALYAGWEITIAIMGAH
ncbi:MAG TPA: hypothetical protein VER17_11405 [Tepidisphaeraceae bacterium]|nr:hypothetical protein [Tepidisphaeraceae bacterium]